MSANRIDATGGQRYVARGFDSLTLPGLYGVWPQDGSRQPDPATMIVGSPALPPRHLDFYLV
jgi:hypothetical protein